VHPNTRRKAAKGDESNLLAVGYQTLLEKKEDTTIDQGRLPRSDLVVGISRETSATKATVIAAEASSVTAATKASCIATEAGIITSKASISVEAASVTTTKTAVGLIVSTIVPVNSIRVLGLMLLEEIGKLLLALG
jgi:hypothetical protein